MAVNDYCSKFVYPRAGIVQSATRNLTSELEALAAADPTTLFAQMKAGKTFGVLGGGRGIQNRNVTFTVVSVTMPAPATPGAPPPPPPPLSYDVHFAYRTSFGDVGSVVVPIRRMGTETTGCDLANGVTTGCSNYVVPVL